MGHPEAAIRRCFSKVVLKNFSKLTGKHLYQRLFLNKVAGLPLLQNTTRGLLLAFLPNYQQLKAIN